MCITLGLFSTPYGPEASNRQKTSREIVGTLDLLHTIRTGTCTSIEGRKLLVPFLAQRQYHYQFEGRVILREQRTTGDDLKRSRQRCTIIAELEVIGALLM